MTVDLKFLAWSCVLGLVYLFTAAQLATRQRGFAYNVGNRDAVLPALTGTAARAARAWRNFLETFGFFAAAVLAVAAAGKASPGTAFGAELYFYARVLYLPVYIFGVPYVRSFIWLVSVGGLLTVLRPLLALSLQ